MRQHQQSVAGSRRLIPSAFRCPLTGCLLPAAAFKIFSEESVDVAIIEVGLGGRLDSTNCIRAPVVCGISALGFDHMHILGHTLPVTNSPRSPLLLLHTKRLESLSLICKRLESLSLICVLCCRKSLVRRPES